MTRPIKFRAWDKKNAKMFNVIAIDWHTSMILDPQIESHKLNFTPLMQFTGLLDKNGKEIYEGDILEFPSFENGKGHVVIEWKKTMFVGLRYHELSEIIGNIYENPSLMSS